MSNIPQDILTLNVFGRDRAGAVARFTSFLFSTGANIEALSERVTRGQFVMTVVASWLAGKMNRLQLEASLRAIGRELGMDVEFRYGTPGRIPRMAILVTRETHCAKAVLEGVRRGVLKCKPVLMGGNLNLLRPLAKRYRLPFFCTGYGNRDTAEKRLLAELSRREVDFIVLARFMRILSPGFVWRYRNRIINIHPSLLPSFPGAAPYRQALERGVKFIGATAHFADESLDGGPIIAQDGFRMGRGEKFSSIVKRGREIEARVLVEGVRVFLTRKLDVHWGRVFVE